MDGTTIEALLERISLRDRKAFSRLYDETSGRLLGICLRVLKDRQEAEEALQETYLRVWQKAGSFARGRAPAMAWLAVVARNAAIDRRRASKLVPVDVSVFENMSDPGRSPEDDVLDTSDARRLQECLEELDSHHAQLIRKAFFTGETYAQLAEALDTPLGTVKSWIRRSLIKLRNCLDTLT